jgi:hypothetical protein
MNVTIQIIYLTEGGRAYQAGQFPLKGQSPEKVAYKWLQQIKKQIPTFQEVLKVTANGDQDITEQVKELEKGEREL